MVDFATHFTIHATKIGFQKQYNTVHFTCKVLSLKVVHLPIAYQTLCWGKGLESCNTSSCHSGISLMQPLSISNDYFSLPPPEIEAYQH